MELVMLLLEKFWLPVLATAAAAYIKHRMEQRPRLVAYLSHASAIPLINIPGPLPPPQPIVVSPAAMGPVAGGGAVAIPAPGGVAVPAPGPAAPGTIHTHSILVRNVGNSTAFNVRITHNAGHIIGYQVQPTIAHSENQIINGGWELFIPALVAGAQVQVAYLYPNNVFWGQIYGNVTSDEGAAEVQNVVPVKVPNLFVRVIVMLFFYVGIFASAYVLYLAASWILTVVRAGALGV